MPAKYSRKRRGRRRFTLRRVRTTPIIALSTLASGVALAGATTGVSTDTYRIMTASGLWSITGLTPGEGPLTFGYAHSDYSVTEIKEAIEAAAIDKGDKLLLEKSNRLVRIVGTLVGSNAELNNGNPVSTRLNWLISIGDQLNIFVYNESAGALTTGSSINFVGNVWVKDSV